LSKNNNTENSPKSKKSQKRSKQPKTLNCPILEVGTCRTLRTKIILSADLTPEVLAEEIRFRIWERKKFMLLELVKEIGNEIAIQAAEEVTEIEKNVSY